MSSIYAYNPQRRPRNLFPPFDPNDPEQAASDQSMYAPAPNLGPVGGMAPQPPPQNMYGPAPDQPPPQMFTPPPTSMYAPDRGTADVTQSRPLDRSAAAIFDPGNTKSMYAPFDAPPQQQPPPTNMYQPAPADKSAAMGDIPSQPGDFNPYRPGPSRIDSPDYPQNVFQPGPTAAAEKPKSIYERYGVTPPDIQQPPSEPRWFIGADLPIYRARLETVRQHNAAELQRAEIELRAAQTGEDVRRQAHHGTTRDVTVRGADGKWHSWSVFQPSTGGDPTRTDLGEAPDPEMRWLTRSQNPEGELIRTIQNPNTDPQTRAWAQDQLDQSRRFSYPAPREPAQPRPTSMPATIDLKDGTTTQGSYDPATGRYRDGDGNVIPAANLKGARKLGTPPTNPKPPKKSFADFLGTGAAPTDSGTAGGEQAPIRPDALPRAAFVKNFTAKRGRPPTDAELGRARAQGYIR
jgi:hypothetical protein